MADQNDVASLGFKVDSSQAVTATRNLDALKDTTQRLSQTTQSFTLAQAQQIASVRTLGELTQGLTKNISATETALDSMLRKMDETRTKVRSFGEDIRALGQLQAQIEGLGAAFGATSTGMEAYYRQAQQMGLTTAQTVASLQRITEALQNQTSAGREIRKVLTDYGVSLGGLGTNDADKVLARYTERMRQLADTAQKFRTAETVLGPLDGDAYAKINTPGYVSYDSRRDRAVQAQYSRDIADRTRNAVELTRSTDRKQAEYADLSQTWNLGGAGSASGLSADQRTAIRAKLGIIGGGTGVGSRDDQLQLMRWLQANPNSSEAASAVNIQGMLARQGGAELPGLSRWSRFLGSGNFSANREEINARYDQEAFKDGTWSASLNRIGRATANVFGAYQPLAPIADTRQRDPNEILLERASNADTVARFGDRSLQRRLGARQTAAEFAEEVPSEWDNTAWPPVRRNTRWGTGKDGLPIREQIPAVMSEKAKATRKVYEDEFGPTAGGDSGYAEMRYRQAKAAADRASNTSWVGNQDRIDSYDQQNLILSLPRAQRARAAAFLEYAPSAGMNAGVVLDQARRNPQQWLSQLDGKSPGVGTPSWQQAVPFQREQRSKYENDVLTQQDGFRQRITDQAAQTDAAKQGAGALEVLTTRQNAYNAALAANKDITIAKRAADLAEAELMERKRTQDAQRLADLERENKLEEAKVQRVNMSGTDRSDRLAAGMQADRDAEWARMVANNTTMTREQFDATQNAKQRTAATSEGNDLVAGTTRDLDNAKQLLSVAGQTQAVRDKAQRDLQTEMEFASALAKAKDSADQAAIARIQSQIELTKRLKDEIAGVNAEAKLFQMGREGQQSAADDKYIMGLPRSERGRARAQLGAYQAAREAGIGGMPDGQYGPPVPSGGPPTVTVAPGGGTQVVPQSFSPAGFMGAYGGVTATIAQQLGWSQSMAAGMLALESANGRSFAGKNNPGNVTGGGSVTRAVDNQNGRTYSFTNYDSVEQMAAAFVAKIQRQWPGAVNAGDDPSKIAAGLRVGQPGGYAEGRPGDPNPQGTYAAGIAARARWAASGGAATGSTPVAGGGGLGAALAGTGANYDQQQNSAAQNLREEAEIQRRGATAQMAFTRRGETAKAQLAGAANYDDGDPQGALKAAIKLQQMQQQFQSQFASAQAETDISTEQNKALAEAYGKTAEEIDRVNEALKVQAERRAMNLSQGQQEERAEQLRQNRISKQGADLAQQTRTTRLQNDQLSDENSISPFASTYQRSRQTALMQLERDFGPDGKYSSVKDDDAKQRLRDTVELNEKQKESNRQLNDLASAWQTVGSSAKDTLFAIGSGSMTAQQGLSQLANTLAKLLLDLASKPLMQKGGDFLSELLGLGKGLGGGGSSGVGLADGVSMTSAGVSVGTAMYGPGFASGGAFAGGTRFLASGGLLDRPTRFFASGGMAVAGEVGTEAIMPLRRMPNGDLGVSAGSGGRGSSITVHAPITINGDSMAKDGSGMDPKALANLQAQIDEMMRSSAQRALADEKRPGGMLY